MKIQTARQDLLVLTGTQKVWTGLVLRLRNPEILAARMIAGTWVELG